MNNERFLVFDIDDTLYSQMDRCLQPVSSVWAGASGSGAGFTGSREKKRLKCFCSARVDRFPFMNPGFTELKIL